MADEMNQNVAILSLVAALKDNTKELTANVKKQITQVEKNAGEINFTGNTEDIQKKLKEIVGLLNKELKGVNTAKYLQPILEVFSDATKSAEEYTAAVNETINSMKDLAKIGTGTSAKVRKGIKEGLPHLNQRDIAKALTLQKQLEQAIIKSEGKISQAKEKYKNIEASSLASLRKSYKTEEKYISSIGDEAVSNLASKMGIQSPSTDITKDLKEFSELISLFEILKQKKEELSNSKFDLANEEELKKAQSIALENVETTKTLVFLYDQIEKKQGKLSSKYNIQDTTIGLPENYQPINIRDILTVNNEYVEKIKEETKKSIDKAENELASYVKERAEKRKASADAEFNKSMQNLNRKTAGGTEGTDKTKNGIENVGDAADNAKGSVEDLGEALDGLVEGKSGSSSELDLWAKSAENLKDQFADVIKYAVDAEEALENIKSLNKTLNKKVLSKDEEKDLVGFSQRYLSLGNDLTEDQENTFYDYADNYKKMTAEITKMTEVQLAEIKKLKAAQKEVSEQPISSTDTSTTKKQVEETTESIEKLAQAEKEVKEQSEKLEKNFLDGIINKEEIKELISLLEDLNNNSNIKVDVDIQEAVINTDTIQEKIDNLPEVKDIKIRVHDTDYSNTSLLSDEEGRTITAFRGVKNAWSGVVNDKEISFFTDQLELAADYADSLANSGKVYAANLSFKNPLEIDGNGAIWNEIEFDGIKRTTDEIVQIAKQLGHDGVIFRNIRDGFGEANGELSNVMVTLNRAQIKNEEVVASVKANSREITRILNSKTEPNSNIESQQKLKTELQETEQQAKETAIALSGIDQSSVLSSPAQEFDNEIQKNLVNLENYKNTIKEIDALKLEPETEETKRKIEELIELSKYFLKNISILESEGGNEVSIAGFKDSFGSFSKGLTDQYPDNVLSEMYDIGKENSGLRYSAIKSEFSGISEEIQKIESKSEELRNSLRKDLTDSSKYIKDLKHSFITLVASQEELKTETNPKWIEGFNKDIDKALKKFPELEQFKDKFATEDQALKFTKSDGWNDFLATLPQAKAHLESIGYEFKKIVQAQLPKQTEVLSGTDTIATDTPPSILRDIDSEKSKLKELESAISSVIEEIDRKTQAFHNEKAAVDMIIPAEIATLEALEGELIIIRELLEQLSKIPIDISFKTENLDENTQKVLDEIKTSLAGIDTSSLSNISTVLEGFKISKANIENLQKLANAILTLKSNLNNVSGQGQQFLSDIKELIAQADGLKDLATVLKATRSQIVNVKKDTRSPIDEDELKIKELNDAYDELIVKLNKYDDLLNREKNKTNKTSAYKNEINGIQEIINKLANTSIDIIDESAVEKLKASISEIENKINSLKKDKKFDLVSDDEINNLLRQASKVYNKNTAAPKELRENVQSVINKLETMKNELKEVDRIEFNKVKSELKEFEAQIERTGKTGASMVDKIQKKFGDVAAYFATYVSIQDALQVVRQGFETIKEYDTALTEMNKVSKESIQTLKEFQKESFSLADSVGTTASQIQNSTADFLRLGESFDKAKQSAQDANALLKVSEFESINEATDALISMSQAYNELEKSEINDILNYVGNNFSLSTSDLATALQDAAAVLKTQGNDIYEAVALITAGNAITQDPLKTAGGIRTISLRLAGTEEAKQELESLGESVDDYIVQTESKTQETIKNLTAVASNAGKGIDVLDANGNLRNTYDILLDISRIYKEIQEEDKKAGTNRANAIVEYIAGKNRSNIASSILLNPELLESVYKESMANSEGSVAREMEAQLESIESHLNSLKNAWDSLWINENNREVITFFLDLAKGILEAVDSFGVLNTLLFGGGGIFTAIKSFKGKGKQGFKNRPCFVNMPLVV